MKIWTESVLISDLEVGDYLIKDNTLHGPDLFKIETLQHGDGFSIINGKIETHLNQCTYLKVNKLSRVVRSDFYQEVADRWGVGSRREAKELFLATGCNIKNHASNKKD